jgi:pimeloyl-ACP methyl ester carboxylesterase
VKTIITFFFSFYMLVSAAQNTDAYITPKPTGPWGVGKRTLEWTDNSRTDITDSSHPRIVPVCVWYPVDKTEATPQYSLSPEWREEQRLFLEKKLGAGGAAFIQNLKVWAQKDVPPTAAKEKFPVLIFGPGYTWLPTDYATIIEDVVSHGYIVVGYVPTGFAGAAQLLNGKIIRGTVPIQQQDITFEDAYFVRKNLYRLADGWLKDNIDLTRIGIFGHSQGGAAATVVAARDTSIKAFVNLDGDLMDNALKVKVTQPGLILSNDERVGMASATGKMDREGRERSEYRRHADIVRASDNAKVALRIRINDIRHLNFTDLALIPDGKMTPEEMKNKIGKVNGASTLLDIAAVTREFFDAWLKNKTFYTLVDLENKYPQMVALLWRGLPAYK